MSAFRLVMAVCCLASLPTTGQAKTLELILDAPGSMNARLASGETRLEAGAKTVLRPGQLEVAGATLSGHTVYDAGGEVGVWRVCSRPGGPLG